MDSPLRILIVEDQPSDVELAMREVRKTLESPEFAHVDTKHEFLKSLEQFKPDLIISDYDMPSFDGLTVISLTLQQSPLTPVIIFTGAIDEETAAESVKAGAVDYVIKGNMVRFRQAVLQALDKKKMWQERIDADERLRLSEERYRLISSVTSDYMFSTLINPDNTMEQYWVAGAFEEISGYTFAEYKALGGWRATVHPEDLAIDDADFKALTQNRKVRTELRTIRKNGDIAWVEVFAHPVWDTVNNRLTGIYGAVKDINKRKQAEEEIQNINLHLNQLVKERTRELEILNRTKDKFFSIIAHDLKGPVAVIIASAEMMLRTIELHPDDSNLLKKYSENILRSTQEGYKLLENLLDWARTQTGVIQYVPVELDETEIIRESLETLKLSISQKNIVIQAPEDPFPVYADKNMLGVILRNLISNAVKYSHPGGLVSIRVSRADDQVVTEVTDQGTGMSEKIKSGLFRIERKNSCPGTRNEKGTGLGLILCKEFVDKMGGDIRVESKPGHGSTFIVSLPAGKSS